MLLRSVGPPPLQITGYIEWIGKGRLQIDALAVDDPLDWGDLLSVGERVIGPAHPCNRILA